jgi:opacity protein-like surface antigen
MSNVRFLAGAVLLAIALTTFAAEAEPSPRNALAHAGPGRSLGDHAWADDGVLDHFLARNFSVGWGGEPRQPWTRFKAGPWN